MLLPFASTLEEADARLRPLITPALLEAIVGRVPDGWLGEAPGIGGPDAQRAAYVTYLLARLDAAPIFVEEARNARSQRV